MGFLQRFFYGRNGSDQLNIAILVLGIILLILQYILGNAIFAYLYYFCIILFLFRAISRSLSKRQAENAWFLQKTSGIREKFRHLRTVIQERKTHKYLKCPNCKKRLRVPRGKGKIKITCAGCRLEFFRKV